MVEKLLEQAVSEARAFGNNEQRRKGLEGNTP